MHFFVGTSGYSYKEWKGTFYPEKQPQSQMLNYYSRQFCAVEANSTFRRMPKASVLKGWAEEVPDGFRFAIKAPQAITHFKRLKDVADETQYLLSTASALEGHLGPLLFQLPPNFKKDVPRLDAFLSLLGRTQAAFEFRHESWFDDEVFACLRKRSCALCIADTDDAPTPELVSTAGWGYLRLRREKYTAGQLRQWLEKIKPQSWSEAWVFFKHEESGTGPKFAEKFLELAAP